MRAFFALALLAAPASAQEVRQTPEGAMRFLDTVAQQGSMFLSYHYASWPLFLLQYKIERIEPVGDCAILMSGKPHAVQLQGWPLYRAGSDQFDYGMKEFSERYQHKPMPVTIDFSKVTSITLTGSTAKSVNDQKTVLVKAGTAMGPIRLTDEALAKRVQYAMTFLKEACDKTVDTGF